MGFSLRDLAFPHRQSANLFLFGTDLYSCNQHDLTALHGRLHSAELQQRPNLVRLCTPPAHGEMLRWRQGLG
jgi:hypothetical protein